MADPYTTRGYTSSQIIRRLESDADSFDRRDFRATIKVALDIYEGRLTTHVNELLSTMFHPRNYRRLRLFPHLSTNLMQRIVQDAPSLYSRPANRKLEGEVNDSVESSWASYLEQREDIDSVMQQVQRLLLVTHNVLLKPTVRIRDDKSIIVDDIYTPDEVRVATDERDPLRMIGLSYKYRVGDKYYYDVWTDDEYKVLDEEWHTISSEVNKYGFIPFTIFRRSRPINRFWCYLPMDLTAATLEICALETLSNARARAASFKQLFFSGLSKVEDLPADMIMDPTSPIPLMGNATVQVVDMQANIQQLTDLVEARMDRIANSYGISAAQFKMQAQAQSGLAIKLQNEGKRQLNDEMAREIVPAEELHHRRAMVVAEVDGMTGVTRLPDDVRININLAELEDKDNTPEQIAKDERDLKLGLITPVDLMMREDPDLSRDDAEEKIRENRDLTKSLGGKIDDDEPGPQPQAPLTGLAALDAAAGRLRGRDA